MVQLESQVSGSSYAYYNVYREIQKEAELELLPVPGNGTGFLRLYLENVAQASCLCIGF